MLAGLMCWMAARGSAVPESFMADSQALTARPHRLAGTAEGREAVDHIVQRLREIGVDERYEQPFSLAQTRTIRCTLAVDGSDPIALLPLRPNGVIPPVSPPEGFRGRLVDIGLGRDEDLDGVDLSGALVVTRYDAGTGWLRALRLGAQAVLFTDAGPLDGRNAHHSRINANVPRFYYDGPASDLPLGREGVIHSEVVWERSTGRNVIGLIRGSDPVFDQEKEEVLILSARIDSFGDVPERSPGALDAINCAGLLELAERIVAARPRRHVLVVFFDHEARGLSGSRLFYRALETRTDSAAFRDAGVEARARANEEELEFVRELRRRAGPVEGTPLPDDRSTAYRELVRRLQAKATRRKFDVDAIMLRLREERMELEVAAIDPGTPVQEERAEAINQRLDLELTPLRDTWNDLRRSLGRAGRGQDPRWTPPILDLLDEVLGEVRQDLENRLEELELEQQLVRVDRSLYDLLSGKLVVLHLHMLLGDTTARWGFFTGGDFGMRSHEDTAAQYGRVQNGIARAVEQLRAAGEPLPGFSDDSVARTMLQTRVLLGAERFVHGGEVGGMVGVYNGVLGTCQENRRWEGTPHDVLARYDMDRIARQFSQAGALLCGTGDTHGLIHGQELSLPGVIHWGGSRYYPASFQGGRVSGPTVMSVPAGSAVPNEAVPGAIVQVRFWNDLHLTQRPRGTRAYDDFEVAMTDGNGSYSLGLSWIWYVYAGGGSAFTFDTRGRVKATSGNTDGFAVTERLNIYETRQGWMVLPPQWRTLEGADHRTTVFNADGNSPLPADRGRMEIGGGVLAWYAPHTIDRVKAFGLNTVTALNNGPPGLSTERENPLGTGFPVRDRVAENISARSSADLWRINRSRLQILEERDIPHSSLAEFHGRAEDLLLEAEASPSITRAEALQSSAFWASRPVYQEVRGIMDDLVIAVLILLGLAVPFAFALERVIIGSVTVYRQLGGFAGFFLATFLLLYFSHPAFAIAATPIVIFLGFAILVMSVLVIGIIMSRFEKELKRMQGMEQSVHNIDVSRMGTLMAAMHMGISTMRRRPMRTTLTATTILLLTFTILGFASFSMQSGTIRLFLAPNPEYAGVWLHSLHWSEMPRDVLDVVRSRWAQEDLYIAPRFWIAPPLRETPGFSVTTSTGERPVELRGLLGIESGELLRRPDLSAVVGDEVDGGIVLSDNVARVLGVGVGDEVLLRGIPLEVRKIARASELAGLRDMDGSGFLPVDFAESTSAAEDVIDPAMIEESQMQSAKNWSHMHPDLVAIVEPGLARRLGADLRGISFYTEDFDRASTIAGELTRMLPLPVVATRTDGVHRHLLGTVLAASGVRDLFFPLLLGGLVVLGTMLGSVTDREKEIYTFSALGLAPRHVAMLFFAEAMVYALIGGLGGYLTAQVTMKVLSVLAEHGLAVMPDMNVSSTNTIVAILIVMCTVLASAIYPAMKASRSANPGLMRSWKVPTPDGDLLNLVFPFTVSEYDLTGIVSFLKQHFDGHSESGLGRFISHETRLLREGDGQLGLDAELALAPYDLGVSQSFALRSRPSSIEGIDEINILLHRRSGQPGDWKRLNKTFLDDLRQQFLLWRALPRATMEVYREQTLVAMNTAQPPEPGTSS